MTANSMLPPRGENGNTWTHLIGVLFALSSIWLVWPAVHKGWQMAMGVLFFIVGMFLMFLSSTLYHWARPGVVKRVLQRLDHINIYVMIACSYTPICIGVIGGWLGWTLFGIQWAAVIGGTFYKIVAFGKHPRLSLALYLIMGWCLLLVFPSVVAQLSWLSILLLLSEGVFYTAGTYFFAHDDRQGYHTVWHIFVILGAMSHWGMVLTLLV